MLQPLPVPARRWGSVSTDFITGLPRTANGYDAILVFVDRLSKMAHFIPTTKDVQAREFAQLFLDHVIKQHGIPSDIVSDRGSLFTSEFWTRLCERLSLTRKLSTAYHPQTDGQTERMNRVLEDMLRHYVDASCSHWDDYLATAEFAVNSAINSSTEYSPFMMMYGENPPTPLTVGIPGTPMTEADQVVSRITEVLRQAKMALSAAQSRAKVYADAKRMETSFEVNDLVLLSTKNLKLKVQKTKRDTKLLPKFIGPLRVLERIGRVAYRLEMPPRWKVHDVFHVSLLRKYVTRGNQGYFAAPPVAWLDEEPLYEVEKILQHADVRTGRKVVRRFLIKWANYDASHNSWEREDNLVSCDEVLADYWQRYNRDNRAGLAE